ncbi:MAG TPA: hypothetical protein VJZ27_13530, partial [Aggregatilineales bacterium]|nr:hypothetical protein [Aggregatilineales bacterium]
RYTEQIQQNELLRGRAIQLDEVFSLGQMIRQGASLEVILEALVRNTAEVLEFRKVMIRLADAQSGLLEPVAQIGRTAGEYRTLRQASRTIEDAHKLLQPHWSMSSGVYFLPAEHKDQWTEPHSNGKSPEQNTLHSWQADDVLIAPLRSQEDDFLGWIEVSEPVNRRRPTSDVSETLEIFASEAAFSIEHYRLLEGIREESDTARAERDRLALLHTVAGEIQRAPDIPNRLRVVVEGIQQAGWNKVRVTMRDEDMDHTLLVHGGYDDDEVMRLNAAILPGAVWKARLNDEGFQALKIGAAYYLRYDEPWVQQNILRGEKPDPESVDADQWHPQDMVYLPLYGRLENRIIGIIGMDDPADGMRTTESSLRPIELFVTQASAAIENTTLYLESVRQKESEQRLTQMMESVAATLEMESVLRTLADGLQQMIPFTRMHVALPVVGHSIFHLRRIEVTADQKVHLFDDEPVAMENTALEHVYRDNTPVVYHLHT